MSARDQILAQVRAALGPEAEARHAAFNQRIAQPVRGPLPTMETDLASRFSERAARLASDVAGPLPRAQAVEAVARYLAQHALPRRVAGWPELETLPWAAHGLTFEARPARADDPVGVTAAFAGIAETGTLVLCSGAETSAVTSLLPETHVAVLPVARLVATLEDALDRVRTAGPLPRAINLVSGPSRTADVEQTVTLGAHGPRRVLIVLTSN
jgi:L-lactate dehydrogenase complex protein LldG